MSHVSKVTDGYGEQEKNSEVKTDSTEVGAGLNQEMQIAGNVVVIKESEKLGPSAYSSDDVGIQSFAFYNQSYKWLYENNYEGKLNGRVSLETPDDFYLIWLVKDGKAYLKWVEADYRATMNQIEAERRELVVKMCLNSMKTRFKRLMMMIDFEKELIRQHYTQKTS